MTAHEQSRKTQQKQLEIDPNIQGLFLFYFFYVYVVKVASQTIKEKF